jgi:membrane protein
MIKFGKKKYRNEIDEPGRLEKVEAKFREFVHFLTYGIWRSNPDTLSNSKNILYNATKTIILTVRNIKELNIPASARSLTYRTLLSIVPLLAVLFAIARGFGIENIVESSIFNLLLGNSPNTEIAYSVPSATTDTISLFSGETSVLDDASTGVLTTDQPVFFSEETTAEGRTREFINLLFQLIDNSLEEAKGGGIFAGIGILLLLYTILLLFNEIENIFNQIWQVRKGRSVARKVTDYTAMVLLMPLFFILVNALNILSYPQNQTLKIIYILYPFIPRLLDIVPYIVIILLFTVLYKFLPNTKVKFKEILEESLRLDPNKPHSLYELGRLLKRENNPEGKKMIQQAFDTWKRKFDTNQMSESDYSWLSSAADELGMRDFAQQVRESKPQFKGEKLYNSENLTITSREEGLIKK